MEAEDPLNSMSEWNLKAFMLGGSGKSLGPVLAKTFELMMTVVRDGTKTEKEHGAFRLGKTDQDLGCVLSSALEMAMTVARDVTRDEGESLSSSMQSLKVKRVVAKGNDANRSLVYGLIEAMEVMLACIMEERREEKRQESVTERRGGDESCQDLAKSTSMETIEEPIQEKNDSDRPECKQGPSTETQEKINEAKELEDSCHGSAAATSSEAPSHKSTHKVKEEDDLDYPFGDRMRSMDDEELLRMSQEFFQRSGSFFDDRQVKIEGGQREEHEDEFDLMEDQSMDDQGHYGYQEDSQFYGDEEELDTSQMPRLIAQNGAADDNLEEESMMDGEEASSSKPPAKKRSSKGLKNEDGSLHSKATPNAQKRKKKPTAAKNKYIPLSIGCQTDGSHASSPFPNEKGLTSHAIVHKGMHCKACNQHVKKDNFKKHRANCRFKKTPMKKSVKREGADLAMPEAKSMMEEAESMKKARPKEAESMKKARPKEAESMKKCTI